MGVWQPGVQGKHRNLDGEAEGKGQEQPGLQFRRKRQLIKIGDAETVDVRTGLDGLVIDENDRYQHQQRADRRVDKELDRSVNAPATTPDTDHEIHGDQHQFPEDVEEEQVKGNEGTQHGGFKQQGQGHEAFDVLLHGIPGGKDRDRHDEGGQ